MDKDPDQNAAGETVARQAAPPHAHRLFDLRGRIAVVTGGCQNFGLEIATGLGEAGADLAVTSRHLEKAQKTAAELARQLGVRVLPIELDVTHEPSVIAAFQQIADAMGPIDVLVNNAGGHFPGSSGHTVDESSEVWRGFLEINLTGTFLCIRECAKVMIPRRSGSIVNIASITSLVGRDRSIYEGQAGMRNPIGYTSAKAGVLGLTFDTAADLGRYGIRVNAISPGGFERGQPEGFVTEYSRRTMLGRMGRDGHDLKGPVVFLASDAAAYVTGINLVVDGGFLHFK